MFMVFNNTKWAVFLSKWAFLFESVGAYTKATWYHRTLLECFWNEEEYPEPPAPATVWRQQDI